MVSSDGFTLEYGTAPAGEIICPYRVCPLGAHTDHNLGTQTGFALDRGIYISYSPSGSETISASSALFDRRIVFDISNIPSVKQNDKADYLRGAALILKRKYNIENGINAFIHGTMPVGGLSSSAAVTLGFINALCKVNSLVISREEMIDCALFAEREYVGVRCGKLDQTCEMYGKKDNLLYIDSAADSHTLIPAGNKDFDIAVFFAGKQRVLAGGKYNLRVDELKAAAYVIKAFSGGDYGTFAETFMADVSREDFEKYACKLPDNFRMRAAHFFDECERVEKGVEAFRQGDLERFGSLMTASGFSSINLWQTGSDELRCLTEILSKTKGVYGARFSGAGFNGSCAALTDPEKREEIEYEVKKEYLKIYPRYENEYLSAFCKSADAMEI